jgi:16S rRNA G1207 methylase RsmC
MSTSKKHYGELLAELGGGGKSIRKAEAQIAQLEREVEAAWLVVVAYIDSGREVPTHRLDEYVRANERSMALRSAVAYLKEARRSKVTPPGLA